jgi:hypothetical protein
VTCGFGFWARIVAELPVPTRTTDKAIVIATSVAQWIGLRIVMLLSTNRWSNLCRKSRLADPGGQLVTFGRPTAALRAGAPLNGIPGFFAGMRSEWCFSVAEGWLLFRWHVAPHAPQATTSVDGSRPGGLTNGVLVATFPVTADLFGLASL